MLSRVINICAIILLLSILTSKSLCAQELNFSVTVQAPQVNIADPKVFKTMEQEIQEFLNTTKWTSEDFEPEERIEGNLLITITNENSANSFSSDFTIQVIRPTYNSSYKTKLFNYKDAGISFSYLENQPIRNSEEKFFDNLSSVLTFYAYVALGLDHDTFSKLGGEPYYNVANSIINSLPSEQVRSGGWAKTSNKRSRFWLMENIYNPRLRNMRESLYSFHRKGLDIMHEDPARGKAIVLSSLKTIQKANQTYPNSMFVQMFGDSKNDEIVEMFMSSDRAEKLIVYEIMVSIDPYRATKYNALKR